MAKLDEPANFGPHKSYFVCLRCRASVRIEGYGAFLRLLYDFEDWQQRECCCSHEDGPVHCCYFADLRQAIVDLPRPH